MPKKFYRTIEDVLSSNWAIPQLRQNTDSIRSDRVLRSTRLEDAIYEDLRRGDLELIEVEQAASKKLRSFPALVRDVYQSFYSLLTRREGEEHLSPMARKFNVPILDRIMRSEDYPTLKEVCEGRELPSYEAAVDFTHRVGEDLDRLLTELGGKPGALNTLEKLDAAQERACENLCELLKKFKRASAHNEVLERSLVAAANEAENRRRQAEAVSRMIDTAAAREQEKILLIVSAAMTSAAEKARETQEILSSWSDDPGNCEMSDANQALLKTVQASETLKKISKYLGRYREILAQCRRNGYAYGRGETYSLELGNDFPRALTSELALLAAPETAPLFIQKYQRKRIKQYRRREPVRKGMGDIICCLDESSSTRGDNAAWGKAVSLTLLEIAESSSRRFALIHFSSADSFQTDLFLPGKYVNSDKIRAAETFLSGGTDFVTPMKEALRLMADQNFENADIVFITDGKCNMPSEFLEALRAEQAARRFTITGILLDQSSPGMEFSLESFCQNVYRMSELTDDTLIRKLAEGRG